MWGARPTSIRRLFNLVRLIPLSGAFGKAIGAVEAQTWRYTEELGALTAELIDQLTRVTLMVNVKKGTPIPKPIKIARPGDKTRENQNKRNATSEELKAMFGGNVRYVANQE